MGGDFRGGTTGSDSGSGVAAESVWALGLIPAPPVSGTRGRGAGRRRRGLGLPDDAARGRRRCPVSPVAGPPCSAPPSSSRRAGVRRTQSRGNSAAGAALAGRCFYVLALVPTATTLMRCIASIAAAMDKYRRRHAPPMRHNRSSIRCVRGTLRAKPTTMFFLTIALTIAVMYKNIAGKNCSGRR
jgi:hypothetical protein